MHRHRPRRFWRGWLQATCVAVIAFGLAMVLLPAFTARGFGLLLYGDAQRLAALDPDARRYVDLLHAVLGAVLVGWGATLLGIVRGPLARGDRDALRLVATGVVAWYVPDTAVSLLSGFWPNAVLNTVFAAAFALPLLALRARR